MVNKNYFAGALVLMLSCASIDKANAQGMHFSQYYHAPLLLNPANTALLPDDDFRIGVNYRNQWATIPVPYKTMSAYADFQVMRNQFETNWMGIGLAFFNDNAGIGDLSLTKIEAMLAYHVQMGEASMLSFGASAGYGMRSVDMSKFTYNVQWDGFGFNENIASQEVAGLQRTNYLDVGAGLNLAIFPNENLYIKLGAGLAHLNQPVESFLNSQNKIGMRPTANIDVLMKWGDYFILNPSFYFTQQKEAREMLAGVMTNYLIGDTEERATLYLGCYYRWAEAIVPAVGIGFSSTRLMLSYDITSSSLNKYNGRQGAMEIGLSYQGTYGEGARARGTYNCPRF